MRVLTFIFVFFFIILIAGGKEQPSPASQQLLKSHPGINKLPQYSGWTWWEIAQKAAENDFDANMQMGRYWMQQYANSQYKFPLIALDQCLLYFKRAQEIKPHPAIPLLMTDPGGIANIYRLHESMPKFITEQLQACEKAAEQGDFYAIQTLCELTDINQKDLERYLNVFDKQSSGDKQLKLARQTELRLSHTTQSPIKILTELLQYKGKVGPVLAACIGGLAAKLSEHNKEYNNVAQKYLSHAAKAGHAQAAYDLAKLIEQEAPAQSAQLLNDLMQRGDMTLWREMFIQAHKSSGFPIKSLLLYPVANMLFEWGEHEPLYIYADALWDLTPEGSPWMERIGKRLFAANNEAGLVFLPEQFHWQPAQTDNRVIVPFLTHRELEQKVMQGDLQSAIWLGEYWYQEFHRQFGNFGAEEEAKRNVLKWHSIGAANEHPVSKFRLAEMEEPFLLADRQEEPVKTLWHNCINKAKEGDFIAMTAIAGFLEPEEYQNLEDYFKPKAREGDIYALTCMSLLYRTGSPAQRDRLTHFPDAAAQVAAQQGDLYAAHMLAMSLVFPIGNEHRRREGVARLYRNALQGNAFSADIWCTQNEWFADPTGPVLYNLAKRGYLPTMSFIAGELSFDMQDTADTIRKTNTRHIPKEDIPAVNMQAISLWENAASVGSLTALEQLTDYYEQCAVVLPHIKYLPYFAFGTATRLAQQQDARGYKRLAKYYKTGFGVTKNPELAKEYVFKAAEAGDSDSLVEQARYIIRTANQEHDYQRALTILYDLYKDDLRLPQGVCFLLGYLHEEGLGVPRDLAKAQQYYLQGASFGENESMNNLGSMYESGNGVQKDLEQAKQWYQKAAQLGNIDAQANLQRLEGKAKN